MFDAFPVKFKFSNSKKVLALRVITIVAFGLITFCNFISTCSSYYSPTFNNECAKALITPGAQLRYPRFMMMTDSQALYDGNSVTDCSLRDVIIQMLLAAPQAPSFTLNMNMDCSNGISIFVYDITFTFWDQYYGLIATSATNYKYYTAIPGWPFDAVEFKQNWTTSASDNNMRFFFGNYTYTMPPQTVAPGHAIFDTIMNSAIQDVQDNAIPGVKYLCSQCGVQANWKGEKFALIW
ncbi:hypothetical protein BGZ80_010127, partial [Entomortierella chlamydospora]